METLAEWFWRRAGPGFGACCDEEELAGFMRLELFAVSELSGMGEVAVGIDTGCLSFVSLLWSWCEECAHI